jgi:uracil-DNA glycosylase
MAAGQSELDRLYAEMDGCRRCAQAGFFVGSRPICSGHAGALFMAVGQAPGRHEAEVTRRPFSGPAGRRLFRWLAEAGFCEPDFRSTQAMAAITRCYPGPNPDGRGDRVPSRMEQLLCAEWLERELALLQPRVLILIGRLAIERFLPAAGPLAAAVGRPYPVDGRVLLPLPHPSGASQWFNQPANRDRLALALGCLSDLRQELVG